MAAYLAAIGLIPASQHHHESPLPDGSSTPSVAGASSNHEGLHPHWKQSVADGNVASTSPSPSAKATDLKTTARAGAAELPLASASGAGDLDSLLLRELMP